MAAVNLQLGSAYVTKDDLDAIWVILNGSLVLLLQTGFVMTEVGAIRRGLIGTTILIKNVFNASIGALAWWALGFGIAYGMDSFARTGKNGFIGQSAFFFEGDGPLTSNEGFPQAFWFFQWAFAAIVVTILSGAIAERANFTCHFFYSSLMTGAIYPVIAHIAWHKSGFLSAGRESRLFLGCGTVDFAGSGVVHFTGGVAALVACLFFAPRPGRFTGSLQMSEFSSVFQTLGTLLLWLGWYALNCGSTLSVSRSGVAGHVAMTTTLAAASGCLSSTILAYFLHERNIGNNTNFSNNGILAGLVSISASCAFVNGYGAIIIGTVGGICYSVVSRLVAACRIDDVTDAFSVHGACGAWGLIAVGIFATKVNYSRVYPSASNSRVDRCAGIFYGGSGAPLLSALIFLLCISVFVTIAIASLFKVLNTVLMSLPQYPMGIAFLVDGGDESDDDDDDDDEDDGQLDLAEDIESASSNAREAHPSGEASRGTNISDFIPASAHLVNQKERI